MWSKENVATTLCYTHKRKVDMIFALNDTQFGRHILKVCSPQNAVVLFFGLDDEMWLTMCANGERTKKREREYTVRGLRAFDMYLCRKR